ncbi:MAG: hypothetical protein MJY43_02345 [Bacteroidales bacterium]|nr:hypothetical protein [Bacteroidales bacterium]
MASQFNSKHGTVSKSPAELYMAFADMRAFRQMLPPDKQSCVEADYDNISATVQGFTVGVKVLERLPYSRITLCSANAPFQFNIQLFFDELPDGKTDFHIDVEAELNMMMKMMLGSRIKDGLDKIVDQLSNV